MEFYIQHHPYILAEAEVAVKLEQQDLLAWLAQQVLLELHPVQEQLVLLDRQELVA